MVRNGPFEGDPVFLFFSNMFHCWHQFQSLTVDVSSIVGAPWRCGVLTTHGAKAGTGLGHQHGREHDSTHQSGVEASVKTEPVQNVLLLLW